jgi:hypothetical protein
MLRKVRVLGITLAMLALLPALALAQSAIVGTVRDSSGAVLPGVTVEASSDALIEKLRTVYTDGAGAFRIESLRPGTYVVVFTLPGFQTVRREGINLPSEFTATINADMRVGALEESITVTGDAPVVDVTTAARTQVLNREAIDAIPTGRTIQGMGQLIVGVNLNLPDTGGARSMQQTYMSTHGMSTANTTVMVDGMMVNGLQGDGAIQSYFNDAMNQEVSYQTSGIGAETSAGGVRLNMIPREGGNRFSGDFKAAYRPGNWQSDNVTDRLQALGLTAGAGNAIDRIIDFTFAQGGPIKQDKLWFFGSARYYSVNNFIANTFFDDGSQGIDDQFIKSGLVRLTWQMSPKNKLSAYFDEIDKFRGHDMQALYDPETASVVWNSPAYHTTSAKLTSTATSRLLLEGGWSSNLEYYTNEYQPGIEQPRGSLGWFTDTAQVESDLGGRQTAALVQSTRSPARYAWNAAASYVTGSHSLKVGTQMTWGSFHHTYDANGDLYRTYRSNSTGIPYTVPDTVVVRNTPLARHGERLNRDLGIYAQDSWNIKRLTVNLGVRWENVQAQVLAASSPAGRFVPARQFDEIVNLPSWKNPAPRFAAVYDLFGNAKTALKYSLNRYNLQRTTGIADQYNPLAVTTRALTWRDLNGDGIPQGDVSFLADGTRVSCVYLAPGCEINFGQLPANFGVRALNTYGEYPRTWNLEHGVEIQHELLPRLSVTGSWFHGDFHNLTATVNQNLSFDDYAPITVFNPLTGGAITAYNISAAGAARAVANLDTFDPNREQVYNAWNFEFRARPGAGAQIFGGIAIERELQVNCTAPDNPNSLIFCNDRENGIPWKKSLKLAGSYPLAYGITLSGSLQSNQSPNSTRTMIFTRTTRYPTSCAAPCPAGQLIAPTLTAASLTIPIQPDRATFVERITQLDFKVQRTFRFGGVSVLPTFEVFNVNNSDAIISYLSTNVLNASFLQPNSIMQGRMMGVGATVRW